MVVAFDSSVWCCTRDPSLRLKSGSVRDDVLLHRAVDSLAYSCKPRAFLARAAKTILSETGLRLKREPTFDYSFSCSARRNIPDLRTGTLLSGGVKYVNITQIPCGRE